MYCIIISIQGGSFAILRTIDNRMVMLKSVGGVYLAGFGLPRIRMTWRRGYDETRATRYGSL